MSHLTDTHAPPSDLDVPAARAAQRRYEDLIKRGVPECHAWAEAVVLFAGHHPSWPLSLSEREAARSVGVLILERVNSSHAEQQMPARRVPLDLLVDLATPETPETVRARSRVEAMGTGAVSIFRGAWKLAGNVRPVSSRLPRHRFPECEDRMHA